MNKIRIKQKESKENNNNKYSNDMLCVEYAQKYEYLYVLGQNGEVFRIKNARW